MKISLSLKVAIGTFFIAGSGILLVSILSYTQVRTYVKENILSSLRFELDGDAKQLNKDINNMIKDVKLLTNNEQIPAIYRASINKYNYDAMSNDTLSSLKIKLGKTFKSILEHNHAYFNIRLIAVSGMELVVSVKDAKGKVIVKDESALQNKATRPYFKEAIALAESDTYISRINLNKENGVFSVPYIHTLRIALPIYMEDKVFGILIINANINQLFSIISSNVAADKSIYLANEEGYYIYNKQKEKCFGFDLGTEYKIENDFHLDVDTYFEKSRAFAHRKVFINKQRYMILALQTSDRFSQEQSGAYQKDLAIYILLITMIIVFFSLLLMRFFISPVIKLTRQATAITTKDLNNPIEFEIISRNDEIGELSKALNVMVERINNSKKEIEQKVKSRTKELHDLNGNLEHIVQEKTQENIKQLKAMQEQNKMASMGAMIGAIAHQWRQPLNEISIAIQSLKYEYEDGRVDAAFLQEFIEKNKEVIHFMSNTIDDFRSFYRVDKTKELFDAKEAINKTLSLQMAQLINNDIAIFISGESFEINGYRNEFLQVVLNIINNAKDALLENKVKHAKIMIELEDKSIIIKDNAGGMPEEILGRIFEPYFTTKDQGKGTGMGLYMSKMIIEENMNAKLSVRNGVDGAELRMDFYEI